MKSLKMVAGHNYSCPPLGVSCKRGEILEDLPNDVAEYLLNVTFSNRSNTDVSYFSSDLGADLVADKNQKRDLADSMREKLLEKTKVPEQASKKAAPRRRATKPKAAQKPPQTPAAATPAP